MKITKRSPTRIDLAGGTLDCWPLYLLIDGCVTINLSVSIFTEASIEPRADSKVDVRMRDQDYARSFDLPTAAARYRERRGRHPPPGFDAWFKYAIDHDAIIVESFFDRISADIAPYWGLDAQTTAERAASWEYVVRVRNGVANGTGNTEGKVPWLQLWTSLVSEAAPFLPDVDMPINYMDESRIIVPWEDVTSLVNKEQESRSVKPMGAACAHMFGPRPASNLGTQAGPEGSRL